MPDLVAKAKENAVKEGVSHLVEFRAQDGLTVDISEASVVTLYMFKWFNNALRPKLQKLKPGARVLRMISISTNGNRPGSNT